MLGAWREWVPPASVALGTVVTLGATATWWTAHGTRAESARTAAETRAQVEEMAREARRQGVLLTLFTGTAHDARAGSLGAVGAPSITASIHLPAGSRPLPPARAQPASRAGPSTVVPLNRETVLRHALLELRSHDDALLLVRVGTRSDEHRRRLRAVDRNVRHSGGHVQVVAHARDLPVF
jgi:hypothetical protein